MLCHFPRGKARAVLDVTWSRLMSMNGHLAREVPRHCVDGQVSEADMIPVRLQGIHLVQTADLSGHEMKR